MNTDAIRFGTVVRLPDGRLGTVVYRGYDGYGIAWGDHALTDADRLAAEKIEGHRMPAIPKGQMPFPGAEALLRQPFHGATHPCVGTIFEIVRQPDA